MKRTVTAAVLLLIVTGACGSKRDYNGNPSPSNIAPAAITVQTNSQPLEPSPSSDGQCHGVYYFGSGYYDYCNP